MAAVTLASGPRVISSADEDWLRLWDVRKGGEIGKPEPSDFYLALAGCGVVEDRFAILAVRPVSTSGRVRLCLWHRRDLAQPLGMPEHFGFDMAANEMLTGVACTAVENRQAIAITCGNRRSSSGRSIEGVIRFWDLRDLTEWSPPLIDHHGAVQTVTTTCINGRLHVATGGDDGMIRLWDLKSGARRSRLIGHDGPVRVLKAVALGERPYIVSGGDDGTVRLWNLETSRLTRKFAGHAGMVRRIVPVTLERHPHVVTEGDDNRIRLWDLESGDEIETLWVPDKLRGLVVTTDGSIIVGLDTMIMALEPGPSLPRLHPIDPVVLP
ncbi:hypothetical protein [Streptomyces sp. MI02-7b]|uniref:WD40 repeat domain-containing protein n=1 Tax=Streptomyces sp. MI02-7b TaxID=462941 RepID=UPI0029AE7C06|nr:hypothetical protein [Streptomyces sp. MI02-7b]MDX3073670.1 hypothetical protein [Streptomyces sp. MI02-7b]